MGLVHGFGHKWFAVVLYMYLNQLHPTPWPQALEFKFCPSCTTIKKNLVCGNVLWAASPPVVTDAPLIVTAAA